MEKRKRAMRDVFIAELDERMKTQDDLFFVSADFGSPALDSLRDNHPTRFINIGIAEQNLVNVSTGLALEGYTVFAYAIAPFVTMRCFEQSRVNLALLSQTRPLNVNLVGVGAGMSYEVSGPTHHCLEDLSVMRTLPNVEVISPADWVTAKNFLGYCIQHKTPKYLRFDAKPLDNLFEQEANLNLESGFSIMRNGGPICLVSTGFMTHRALVAAEELAGRGVDVSILDVYNLLSFDETQLINTLKSYAGIITIEEGFKGKGGLDSWILHLLNENALSMPVSALGLKNTYMFDIGDRNYLHGRAGIDEEGIVAAAIAMNESISETARIKA